MRRQEGRIVQPIYAVDRARPLLEFAGGLQGCPGTGDAWPGAGLRQRPAVPARSIVTLSV